MPPSSALPTLLVQTELFIPFDRGGRKAWDRQGGFSTLFPSSYLAGLFLSSFSVPAEAHIGTRWVFAAAVYFVMRVGLRGFGTIARPVTTLLLVGKVQGIVQGASKEGISFMGLRRTGARISDQSPMAPEEQGEGQFWVPNCLSLSFFGFGC